MSTTGPAPTEEDNVSILSFDDLGDDDALPGSDVRIQRWLFQQCRFGLEAPKGEKELSLNVSGLCKIGGPGELLPTVLIDKHRASFTISERGDEAALRADSPLLGFALDDERTLIDPLHFPSATYVRDLPEFYQKHSPQSSYSSSATKRTLGLSRRPSLLKQPSLPLLDERSVTRAISAPVVPLQPSRSRAESNASISSFHLPTSMQVSLPPLSPTSPHPTGRRHSRTMNSPPLSSTLASFSFGGENIASPGSAKPLPSPIPRPHSQHRHHNHLPPPQKILHTLSRSSSTLSLLTHSRNAIYINEPIDIDSGVDDHVAEDIGLGVDSVVEGGENRLQVKNEDDHTPLNPHTNISHTNGVYFNAIGSSSQVYLGIGTTTKAPTRPPPAPPLIMDEDDKGGLGGVGVIDEDAILNAGGADQEREQLLDEDRGISAIGGDVYPHQLQHIQFDERDAVHHKTDFDAGTDANLIDAERVGDDKPFTSRWSLASSMDDAPASAGGGLFRSIRRMSLAGDKDYMVDREKEIADKEKSVERDKEKEREKDTGKKRGRLVSFISRISSNIVSSPPPTPITSSSSPSAATSTNDGDDYDLRSLGVWSGDMALPPSPVLPLTMNAGGRAGEKKGKDGKNKKSKEKGREKMKGMEILINSSTSSPRLSPLSSPSVHSPSSINGSSNVLRHVSPIVKAFSAGFEDAASALDFMSVRSGSALGSTVVDDEVGGTMMGARSSSATANLLGRRPGDGGEQYDLYRYQYQHHQQVLGQQGQQGLVQGLAQEYGRGQSPSQTRKHISAYLHPQPRLQQGQGYSPETAYYQVPQHLYEQQQHRQRRQSQQLHSQFGLQQGFRQAQTYSSVNDGSYILEDVDNATAADVDATIIPRRPRLVKSVSTPMLKISGGGGGYGYENAYVNGDSIARRNADLPPTPVPFAMADEEEEDYGVETTHGWWRGDAAPEHGSDRERAMTTRETDKKLGTEHSFITTHNATPITTPTATPKASIEVSSSAGHGTRTSRRNSRSTNIIVTNTEKQMRSLVRAVEKKHRSTTDNPPVVRNEAATATAGVALTTTLTLKSTSTLSKGFRGFVERMKFTTTNSLNSSMPSPSLVPPMVPTNIISSNSSTSLFTTSTTTAASAASNTSHSSHSPATSIAVQSISSGSDAGGVMKLADGSFFPNDGLLRSDMKPKRKLVINGLSEEDVSGYEAVKAWCESFGEVSEMRRTPDGYLHVDFRKASVAETVCRLKTQVFIKGAGSVSLSWYTVENKG